MSFAACRGKMQREGLSEWQIDRFEQDYLRLQAGEQGAIAETSLTTLGDIPQRDDLPSGEASSALAQTVVIKLNGGLGTSMGLEIPKGLLEIRQGQTFLDLTVTQVLGLRQRANCRVPLLLMNSFHTQGPTLQALAQRGLDNGPIPLDFLQSKVPKLRSDDLQPVEFPPNPSLEWCPPGHGEIYSALRGSGVLQQLLSQGFRYAFVSNIDNLGATLDPTLLDWFASSQLEFAMEVTRRTDQDRKGGHLAAPLGGGLLLRERAQCQSEDLPFFEDIERHKFFNTNNLWLNLEALHQQPLPSLPLIVNRKTVDPTDPQSTPVIQLESAMGAAIALYSRSQAIEVSRQRFLPVKTLGDLLILRSDLYALRSDGTLEARQDTPLPKISLDPRFYGTYQDFAQRFQAIPSLRECTSLSIHNDVHFTQPQELRGHVTL